MKHYPARKATMCALAGLSLAVGAGMAPAVLANNACTDACVNGGAKVGQRGGVKTG